jgi:hypothetical protein
MRGTVATAIVVTHVTLPLLRRTFADAVSVRVRCATWYCCKSSNSIESLATRALRQAGPALLFPTVWLCLDKSRSIAVPTIADPRACLFKEVAVQGLVKLEGSRCCLTLRSSCLPTIDGRQQASNGKSMVRCFGGPFRCSFDVISDMSCCFRIAMRAKCHAEPLRWICCDASGGNWLQPGPVRWDASSGAKPPQTPA